MRILHLNSNRWNSAITEYAVSLGRAFQTLGATSLAVGLQDSPYLLRARSVGLDTKDVAHFGISSISTIKRVVEDFKPTHVVCYGGPETTLCRLLPKTFQLIRCKGQGGHANGWIDSTLQKISWSHVDKIVVPSASLEQEIASWASERTHVLALGCDETRFYFDEANFRKNSVPEALIFGRFDPVKGHEQFLEIFAAARRLRPMRLHIVGEPANVSVTHLQNWVTARELNQDVVITSTRISNVAALMTQVDLGVISSIGSEYICRVAEEFLLCGTPVLVSGVGSLNDVLVDDLFGASYRNCDVQTAAQILVKMLETSFSETLAEKKKRAERAKKLFSIAAMAEGASLLSSAQLD